MIARSCFSSVVSALILFKSDFHEADYVQARVNLQHCPFQ